MFITEIRHRLESLDPRHGKVVVGVSGGPDSVALALALKDVGCNLVIAHLNHRLRGKESDADETFVREFAGKLKVPCVIQGANIPRKGNLEANARKTRYAFLESVRKKSKATHIAVAHHQDDQIETILMNLGRGTGLRGLRGMQPVSGNVIRPMLGIPKREIFKYLKQKKQSYREDGSNRDTKFLRNRLRHFIVPRLKDKNPYFIEELLDISAQAERELKELVKRAENWMTLNIENDGFSRENFQALHATLKGEVLIRLLGAQDLYAKNINRLIAFIETGSTGKTMTVKNRRFTIEYDRVRLQTASPEKAAAPMGRKRITEKGIVWGGWVLKKKGRESLFARAWKPGDRFEPIGMRGSKKLQDFFVDRKIPREKRREIPIIVNGKDEIISVGNLQLDKRAKKNSVCCIMEHDEKMD